MNILEVKSLSVETGRKRILKNINLEIPQGEIHVLFGPNGSGKSSLILTILGLSRYKVTSGKIVFKGKDITDMPINERAKLGLGVAFQIPPIIRGVKLRDILPIYLKDSTTGTIEQQFELASELNIPQEFLGRDLNLSFSGGEIKRSEILQILAQSPEFVMLDEPDSGVDVENLEIVGKAINKLIKGKSGLLITHLGYILRYVRTDRAHVMIEGRVACSGNPMEILDNILKSGYKGCERCRMLEREPNVH